MLQGHGGNPVPVTGDCRRPPVGTLFVDDEEQCRRFELDQRFDRFEVENASGTHELTSREVGLLRALLDREGQVVSRGELLEAVWGLHPETRTRVVDSFIVRLRKHLEPDPSRPQYIVSVRGHGYKFVR